MVSEKDVHAAGLRIVRLNQIVRSVSFEPGVKIGNTGCLGSEEIGMFSFLGDHSEIKNATIGRFCSIATNVAIGPPEHPIDWVSSHPVQYDGCRWFDHVDEWHQMKDSSTVFRGNRHRTVVGNDVWIGRNATIRQGVKVGTGAIIGAGAFVNKDVEPYTIVVGLPGKPVRKRFSDEVCSRLLESEWWDCVLPDSVRALYSEPERFLDELDRQKRLGSVDRHSVSPRVVRRDGREYHLE